METDNDALLSALVRRWSFESDGDEISVCEGLHEKQEPCEANARKVSPDEAVEIIEKLRSEMLQRIYSPEPEWQPIETAPINESVLIHIPEAEHYGPPIYRGLQADTGSGMRWSVSGLSMGRDCGDRQPTHWMPLPRPPSDPT